MRANLTQRQAIKCIREATGSSWQLCKDKVTAMPKKPEGARQKVSAVHVRAAIAELSAPPKMPDAGIRPLSPKHKAMIRAGAIAREAMEKLKLPREATR